LEACNQNFTKHAKFHGISEAFGDMQATLYVYEMKDSEMAVTKIEHPDPSLES